MRKFIGLLAAAGAAAVPGISAAAGPSLSDVLVNSGITATGSVQASYLSTFNKGQTLAGYFVPNVGDSFSLNQVNLALAYQPTEGFGGLVNVMAGDEAQAINVVYGNGQRDFTLMQGFVSYASGPLTVIAGRYNTLAGAEVIDGSQDPTASRSFLFVNAEPYNHTGVRAAYKIGDTLTAYVGVANSVYGVLQAGNGATDNNKQKTIETGLSWAPTSAVSLSLYDYYSRETDTQGANFMDFVGTFKATDALSFTLNGDWTTVRNNGAAADANIAGLAAYATYTFNDKVSGTLRGEYIETKNLIWGDDDGKSSLSEITAAVSYSPAANFVLIGEVRYDMAGQKVFPDAAGLPGFVTTAVPEGSSDNQGSAQIKAVWKFGTPKT